MLNGGGQILSEVYRVICWTIRMSKYLGPQYLNCCSKQRCLTCICLGHSSYSQISVQYSSIPVHAVLYRRVPCSSISSIQCYTEEHYTVPYPCLQCIICYTVPYLCMQCIICYTVPYPCMQCPDRSKSYFP